MADGRDVIHDFQNGTDLIVIEGASSMRALRFEAAGSDVFISFGDTVVLIEDVSRTQLDASDVRFL